MASISQVMGDRSGSIRWWDVTTGHSSSFNTHRDGIRRIKFSPVVAGDRSRGRIAVLFYDNTFSVYDLVSMRFLFSFCILAYFPHENGEKNELLFVLTFKQFLFSISRFFW